MDKTAPEHLEHHVDLTSPQFSHAVWKGLNWHGIANYAPWCLCAFFLFVGVVVLAEKRDAQHALALFLIAFLSVLTMIPLKRLGKSVLTLGMDKKTNTVWVRDKGNITYEANADRIREFSLKRHVHTKVNPAWKISGPMPLLFKNYIWLLTYKRADNDHFWEFKGARFATEKDATAIAAKANELLRSHMKQQSHS